MASWRVGVKRRAVRVEMKKNVNGRNILAARVGKITAIFEDFETP